MRTFVVSTVFAAALAVASAVPASQPDHQEVRFGPAQFAAQREAILKGMLGETYRELSDEDRRSVLDALERMEARLEGITSLEQLDKRVQTAVFNDQELINTLLTEAAEDSRLICKREKFVGSHRTTNVCVTVAERRRLAAAAQDEMRVMQGSGYLRPERADTIPQGPPR